MVGLIIETPLAQDNISTRILDFLDHISEEILFHLLKLFVVLSRLDLDTVLGLGLWGLEGASEDHDLGVFDLFAHGGMGEILVDNETLNELGVLDGATKFANDLDQIKVHILALEVGNGEH